MKITMIGTGYVGLVTGACFADVGNDVVCFDVDAGKIAALHAGDIPIYEPGLRAAGRAQRRRRAAALHHRRRGERGARPGCSSSRSARRRTRTARPTCKHVLAAARTIGRHMTEHRVVVNKSTVPVGTADTVRAAIASELAARGASIPFAVVSNPEFLKEGAAVDDFMRPDRVIDRRPTTTRATRVMRELYAPFQRNHERMIVMDVRSAELTKYAANAMLATRISFMNEMANLAERLGADIEQVRRGIGSDPRIGYHFLYAGRRLRRLLLPQGREGAAARPRRRPGSACSCSRRWSR